MAYVCMRAGRTIWVKMECSVNPLILIIESMERHDGITDLEELAGMVKDDIGEKFEIKF